MQEDNNSAKLKNDNSAYDKNKLLQIGNKKLKASTVVTEADLAVVGKDFSRFPLRFLLRFPVLQS